MARFSRPASTGSADDYPYDPSARVDGQRGLDQLRCIADRKLAEYLYDLYIYAERNSAKQVRERRPQNCSVDALRRLGARALAGEFGADARELAEYLLVDETGRQRNDDQALREFGADLRRLRRGI